MTVNQFVLRYVSDHFSEEKNEDKLKIKKESLSKFRFQISTSKSVSLFVETDEKCLNSYEIELNSEVISYFSKELTLDFVSQNERHDNVCFANSKEVRDEFRTTFTTSDILRYFDFFLKYSLKNKKQGFNKLEFSKNRDDFWK